MGIFVDSSRSGGLAACGRSRDDIHDLVPQEKRLRTGAVAREGSLGYSQCGGPTAIHLRPVFGLRSFRTVSDADCAKRWRQAHVGMLPAGSGLTWVHSRAVSGPGPRGLDPRRVRVHHGLYRREAMPRPACHGNLRGALGGPAARHRAFGSWEVSRTKPMAAGSESSRSTTTR